MRRFNPMLDGTGNLLELDVRVAPTASTRGSWLGDWVSRDTPRAGLGRDWRVVVPHEAVSRK